MLQELFTNIVECNTMTKMDAALHYAKVVPIFPLIPNTKDPLIQGSWKTYKTQDEAQIRAWWTQYPDANIAMPMGGPILCSDLDRKHGEDGWASYQAIKPGEVEHPMQVTPSGGYHLIHGFVEGLINFTKKGAHGGIDMRTDGGYIVVAPSNIGDDKYQWLQGGDIVKLSGPLGGAYYEWSTASTVDRDVDMPEATPYEDLPPLEGTMLRQKHLDFLNTGLVHESYVGRSEALLGATMGLYQLALSDADVLGYLVGSQGSLQCAIEHSTERRVEVWLWKYNCIKAREKRDVAPAITVPQAFEGIEVLPDVPQLDEKKRWMSMAQNLGADDYDDAIDIYRAALQINTLYADQVANVIHESTGFRKIDVEKEAKKRNKEIALSSKVGEEVIKRGHGMPVPVGHPALNPPSAEIESWNDAVGRYIFISGDNKWFDRGTGLALGTEALNAVHGNFILSEYGEKSGMRFTDVMSARDDTLKVDIPSYWPGIHNPIIHVGNCDAVNTWRPSPMPAYSGDIGPWWELLCHLFPEEASRERIMDWMAFILQHPDVKINHALLVGGGERIGKDTAFIPFTRGIGIRNVSNVKAEMMEEKYDDQFIDVKLAVIQEIYTGGFKDAKKIENKLKVYLADPPEELLLRRLGASHVTQRNLIQLLIFTNHKEAIHVSSDGDRYLCEWSDAEKLSPEAYKKVYDWYNNDYGCEKVYGYLLSRDVSGFNPKAAAPKTEWLADIKDSNFSDMDHEVEDIVDQILQSNEKARAYKASGGDMSAANAHQWHEVLYLTPTQVANKLKDSSFRITPRLAATIMTNLGYSRLDGYSSNHRHRVPREFVGDAIIGGPNVSRFKTSTKVAVFLIEGDREEARSPTPEEVVLGLCPSHLINDYLTSLH